MGKLSKNQQKIMEEQIQHTIQRLNERYDIIADRKLVKSLVKKIQQGESINKFVESTNYTVHDIEYEGKIIRLLYDRRTHTTATALPPPDFIITDSKYNIHSYERFLYKSNHDKT